MSYLDTSIIVPAYCSEPLSDRVDELLRQETNLTVSDLTEVEFYSALLRRATMPDEPQKLLEAKPSESASPVWNQQIAEMIFKAIDGSCFTRRCSRPVQGLD